MPPKCFVILLVHLIVTVVRLARPRVESVPSLLSENHVWMVALHTVFYNWIKIHKTLRVTPAMQAGLSNQLCTFEDLAELIEASTEKAGPRGPYQKKLTA